MIQKIRDGSLNISIDNIANNLSTSHGYSGNPKNIDTGGGEREIYNGYSYFDSNGRLKENADPNSQNAYKTEQIYTYSYDGAIVIVDVTRTYTNGYKSISEGITNQDYSLSYVATLYKKTTGTDSVELSSAGTLQPVVSSWYKAFRNIALVALLSILVYVGIRITLSSTAGDKAKYKQMLVDWTVALCLVFLMHYIMSFAVTINGKIIEVVSSIKTENIGSVTNFVKNGKEITTKSAKNSTEISKKSGADKFDDVGVHLFVIEGDSSKNAYKVLVGDEDAKDSNGDKVNSGSKSSYINRFSGNDHEKLYWPVNDFMAQARLLGQNIEEDNESQSATSRAGYNIIYVVLVIFTVIFCFTYLKRVIYMAFLTIIAPLVAITYPIDKMNDGQAQAFNMWLKEYIFNLLIQPMHLVLYTVLVGSAMKFAATNIFYAVVALGFLVPAEKLLRRFFGFEKAQTPGMFAGPAGTVLMMSGLSKLMHRPPQGKLGAGGKNGKGEDEEVKAPKMNKKIDDTEEIFGSGKDDDTTMKLQEDKEKLLGNGKLGDDSQYDSRLTSAQIESLKNIGIEPGSKRYNKFLENLGIDPNTDPAKDSGSGKANTSPLGTGNKVSIPQTKTMNTANLKGKKRIRKALAAGLRARGRKRNKYYGMKGGQAAIRFAKSGLGMAAKVGTTALGASIAGLASIPGGDPQKAIQNMTMAGASAYAVGKGISGKIENASRKEEITAAKEAYYGKDYEKKQQKEFEKQFAKDEANIKKIQDKLGKERKDAKKIAEQMAKYTEYEGIDDIDQTLAIYQMQQEGKFSDKEILYAASYNKVALDGKNTNHMKANDREEYKKNYKQALINRNKGEAVAEQQTDRLFSAMDRYNKLKK